MSVRTRLLLALLATSAVTLGVAALALLPPLQTRLRKESRTALRNTAVATQPALERALRRRPQPVGDVDRGVLETAFTLYRRTGARITLFDDAGRGRYDTQIAPTSLPTPQVWRVLATDRVQQEVSGDAVTIALALRPQGTAIDKPRWVLLVRQTDTGAAAAVDTVRRAFVVAALVGFGVAAVLGFILSTGITRRLGRLRRSALALAADGVGAAPPVDHGADEVGDLARALASMQRALRRQEEARRAFVATASHELRTPLTSLQGNLELLAEDLATGDVDVIAAQGQLQAAQGQLRRLANLAAELLDLSRLDAGVALRREPVELGEICRAVAAEFTIRARDRALTIDVAPPAGPVWAGADPGAVARVARILLDNALRFSPAGGRVTVAAAYHGDEATIEVADDGPGVPLGERELIFERFQRGTATGGEGGFGLGLAIGRELAERLGGTLTLADDAPPGARFTLRLPIELPRGSSPEPSSGRPAGEPLGRG